MPFRFPLQALLRYRQSYERRELLRLQRLSRELALAREEAEEAKRDRERALKDYAIKLAGGMKASELRFEVACDRTRAGRILACQEHARKVEGLQQRQLEAYLKAHQERKVLDNLRNRQLAGYRLVQNRREQQEADERFLISHGRQGSR